MKSNWRWLNFDNEAKNSFVFCVWCANKFCEVENAVADECTNSFGPNFPVVCDSLTTFSLVRLANTYYCWFLYISDHLTEEWNGNACDRRHDKTMPHFSWRLTKNEFNSVSRQNRFIRICDSSDQRNKSYSSLLQKNKPKKLIIKQRLRQNDLVDIVTLNSFSILGSTRSFSTLTESWEHFRF